MQTTSVGLSNHRFQYVVVYEGDLPLLIREVEAASKMTLLLGSLLGPANQHLDDITPENTPQYYQERTQDGSCVVIGISSPSREPSKSVIFDAASTSLLSIEEGLPRKRQRTEIDDLTTQLKLFAYSRQMIPFCHTLKTKSKSYTSDSIGKSLFFVYILHRLMDDFTTKTLSLKPNRIVYQVGSSYKCFDLQQQLVTELELEVANIVWKQDTLIQGVRQTKDGKEWDFPVWTLDELQTCRRHCYPDVPIETINERYRMYGGVARSVFDIVSNPMEKALADVDAVKGVRNIGFTIKLSANTHTLLHTIVSDDGQYRFLHVDIASRYVGE
ncbi:squalene synthetase-like protein [Batrachochytrium dendrobatidis]|nr:squalene synthetase-like protein [Batrachochytrium dendrobatidis]